MAGIVVACLIVLVAVGAGIFLLMRDDGTSSLVTAGPASTAASSQTTGLPPSTTLPATSLPSATTATSSGQPETSLPPTSSTLERSLQRYLVASEAIVRLLSEDDARIPELAAEINRTAPKVPRAVHDELQTMLGELDAAVVEWSALPAPMAYQESHHWLDEASRWMGERLGATILGVETMYRTGKTRPATRYFRDGQMARDNFRAAFEEFQKVRPAL